MPRHPILSSSFVLLLACGGAHADLGNISKVNKSIHVPSGEVAGDVDTVNGSITIASGATVRSAETVNGSIRIEASARAESAETVNGSVRIGTDGVVMRDAETVNGAVQLEARADVQGGVETVNGSITLAEQAHVGGGIETVNGDIDLGADSRLEGGILIEKPTMSWFNNNGNRKPRITIGPRAQVAGDLVFEREVELFVHDTATLKGKIVGATAKRYSGDRP